MYDCKYPHLFEPLQIRGRLFKNRLFASPTGNCLDTPIPDDDVIAYFERKAIGGAASVCVGDTVVDPDLGSHGRNHIRTTDFFPGRYRLNRLSRAISSHGAVASIELLHAGGAAAASARNGQTIYGPSAGCNTANGNTLYFEEMPEEIIEKTIQEFYQSALNAKKWGFGMITIHGGHGWLLSQFMSPYQNHRRDKWGGTFENNMRLPLAIVEAVRKAVGEGFPIEMRISGSECFDGGYDIDYGIEIAKALDGRVDIIHVSTGSHENDDTFTITHPSMFLDEGCNVKYAAAIKPHIRQSKVATVGALSDPELMEYILASGSADIVEVARGLICDPDLPLKAKTGREEEILHCMRCFACFGSLTARGHIICAENPEIGHEREAQISKPVVRKKKVLIAGGGIGGMQAAITCAKEGHEVILCEKEAELGGILRCESKVPFKFRLDGYLTHQENLVRKLGIDVRLNTEVTPEYIRKLAPDAVISAVGAEVSTPPIPGIRGENVLDVVSCYKEPEKTKQNIVILGGGFSGLELSIYLKKYYGRSVTVVEMLPELNNSGNFIHASALTRELRLNGITVLTGTRCKEITKEGVLCEKDGEEILLNADTVVAALGLRSRNDAASSFACCAPEFYSIGDCNTPRNIFFTTDEANVVARDIGRF